MSFPHPQPDCTIEILPKAKRPNSNFYLMTPRELEELKAFIDKNLASGFIQQAKSCIVAPILFQEKKDGSLKLCIDY